MIAELSYGNALAGATGELAVPAIALALYGSADSDTLTSQQKEHLSSLATLASGIAAGLSSDSTAGAVAGAQAAKNAVENNFLGATSSEKLDKAIEKIKNGDKSLATANELIKLENADKRSDVLIEKFRREPSSLKESERIELNAYVRLYAAEMQSVYGSEQAQEIVQSLFTSQGYERIPDSEAISKAQNIMNTWGYHKSNASIGDAPLLFGSSVLGITAKGMAVNTVIGVGVNSVAQLSGSDPFSYVDAIMAGVAAAATTGKGAIVSIPINIGGAAIGSNIKGEDPTNSVIGTGLGSVFGGGAGKIISRSLGASVKEGTSDIISNIGGSITNEAAGNTVKGILNEADKPIKK